MGQKVDPTTFFKEHRGMLEKGVRWLKTVKKPVKTVKIRGFLLTVRRTRGRAGWVGEGSDGSKS